MILVNVKSYEEMIIAASFSDRMYKSENKIIPDVSDFNVSKDETVLEINSVNGWSYASKDFYGIRYKNEPILSFQEFKEKYLDAKTDNVNSPSHYKQFSREVIDTMQGVSTSEEFKGYLKLNAIKYLSRYQGKNGAEDLAKAVWYINKLKEVIENE